MHTVNMSQRLIAEGLGTAFLLVTVVGSGIMAETLAGGNVAIALLGNTIPTGAILFVLITLFGPISGAHFNPAVSVAMLAAGQMKRLHTLLYICVQIMGGIAGVWLAHAMFDADVFQLGVKPRGGTGQWISEMVATFGLLLVVFLAGRRSLESVAAAVGLYITAAYWFTASTSFANPAVTIARGFSDSFAGIKTGDVPMFIVAQIVGAFFAILVIKFVFVSSSKT